MPGNYDIKGWYPISYKVVHNNSGAQLVGENWWMPHAAERSLEKALSVKDTYIDELKKENRQLRDPWTPVADQPPKKFPVLIRSTSGHYAIASGYLLGKKAGDELWETQDDSWWYAELWPDWSPIVLKEEICQRY